MSTGLSIEIGNLGPLQELAESLAAWESQVRARPLPEADPVVQTLATVRQQLTTALAAAAHVELDLTAAQYATLSGISREALYKRWQRGKLPEARMKGGKLVVPLAAAMAHAA